MIEIIGFAAAIVVGITLGLIGGGGSILTLPILVYIFSVPPALATSYSLFVVGVAALFGAYSYLRRKEIDLKAAALFFIPSFVTVFITRRYIFAALPETLSIGGIEFMRDTLLMALFAVLMISSSVKMILSGKGSKSEVEASAASPVAVGLSGAGVGLITGLFGAGGGFMIIPALTLLAKMPMKIAVGTSLLIIASNTLFGFAGDIGVQPIEWEFLVMFTAFAAAGIFLGSFLGKKISGAALKVGFGWFVLIMGSFIIVKELF